MGEPAIHVDNKADQAWEALLKTPATLSADTLPEDAMQEMARAGERRSAIAGLLYEIGCDITAFGPFCFERIASSTGVSILITPGEDFGRCERTRRGMREVAF
jgi:hypothetical protein